MPSTSSLRLDGLLGRAIEPGVVDGECRPLSDLGAMRRSSGP